ncbi:MAG: hypothetical protein J6W22_13495 [Fibrobacter sp.]|nr:hypothetical protein [Fibrobacter sp.]
MKPKSSIALALSLITASATFAMDENGWASTYESLSAFDTSIPIYGNRPEYVKPIITNLGTILNSNWVSSAGVPQSFTFEAGLPFALVPIGDDDRSYTASAEILGQRINYDTPTIFGEHGNPGQLDARIYGNETLNGLGVFTYPYLQLAGSFYHARLVLRGMFLPSISELKKFNLFGFGLQYSFGHFFQYLLPKAAQGLDASLMFGYSTSGIGYQPEDYSGQLDLDISAYTFNFVLGYRPIQLVEVMMSLGYQSSTMKSSGHLVNKTNILEQINPNLTVKGNSGFRFGIEVALQLGSFHPIVGYDYVGKNSYTTNILYFKQSMGKDKTPDEIAKEKRTKSGEKSEPQKPAVTPEPEQTTEAEPAESESPEAEAEEHSEEDTSEPSEDSAQEDESF